MAMEKRPPLAVEPLDREWGVGVSGLTEEPSPFPRVNRLLYRANHLESTADDQRALIVTEAGGLCTREDGSPLPFDGSKTSVLAGGPQAWADFRENVSLS